MYGQLDCSTVPQLIPATIPAGIALQHRALFVLVIEKEGVFQQLVVSLTFVRIYMCWQ